MTDTDVVKERQIRIVVDSSASRPGMDDLKRGLDDIDAKLAKLGDSVTGGFKKIGAGLLAFISFETIKSNIDRLISAFDQLGSRAATLGVTTDWLQKFDMAAASSSVKLETASGALDKFAKLIGEAQLGTKSAVETLDKLGIKIFDANRQVRPLNDLFEETAGTLQKLNGTALGNALGIQAMGKEYQRVAPMMGAIAQGADGAASSFAKIVSPEKIALWGELASHADKTMLKWRAFAGENFAEPVKAGFELLKGVGEGTFKVFKGIWETLEGVSKSFTGLSVAENISKIFEGLSNIIGEAVGRLSQFIGGVQGLAEFLKGFAQNQNVKLAQQDDLGPLQKEIGGLEQRRAQWRKDIAEDAELQRNRFMPGTSQEIFNRSDTQYRRGRAVYLNEMMILDEAIAAKQFRAEQAAGRLLNYQLGTPDAPPPAPGESEWLTPEQQKALARRRGGAGGVSTGVYGAVATGAGGANDADRAAKRIRELEAEADAQEKMAAKAYEGAGAIAAQEASWKAVQQAMEAYGGKVDSTDPKVVKLAGTFASLNKTIADDKVLTSFRLQTVDIERSNDLLQRRLDLVGASPEIVAREVAIIQVRNEALKDGVTRSQEEIDRRAAAVEKQELLNQKIAQQQQAEQLWMEPLKQALRDIQTYGAGMWESILKGGKITFESIGDWAKQMATKVAAEFLSLATIRPVIGITVAGLTGAGVMSPSYATQMGYGSYLSSGGSGGGGYSGLGLGGLAGGASGWLGDFGQWLNTPLTGPYAGMSPASMQGVPTLSPSLMDPSSWGITPLGAAGALAGAGMGVYQLLNSTSTSGTIGGISSILGAGLSLIPGVGPILGPAVGLLGNILPGLFGIDGPKQPITNQTYGQLSYGSGGWYTTGGAWGPNANASTAQGPLAQAGTGISSIFNLFGGVKNPGSVWGLATESTSKTGSGWDFNSTSSYLLGPNGERELWRMNESDMMGTGAEQVARRSILAGAVGEISANMRKVVSQIGESTSATLEQLATAIAEVKAFDDAIAGLGTTMGNAERAVLEIDQSFAGLYATADKYGLATGDIDAAKAKARLDYATGFGTSISRQILELTDPRAAALQDLEDWKKGLVDNNRWLVDNVTGTLDQINEIERLYGLKRAAIVNQGTEQSLASLENAIKRLTMGDLAGLSPTDALAGSKATYMALVAKADASPGDTAIANSLAGAATDYADIAQSFYASSPAYEAIRQQIVVQLAKAAVNSGGNTAVNDLGNLSQVLAVIGQQVANLTVQLTTATNDNTELKARLAEVTALYLRLAGNV